MNEDELNCESHLETVVSQVTSEIPALVTGSGGPLLTYKFHRKQESYD